MNTKRNSGFSLVEMIIVIAIMAILIGIMAPVLIKYVERTNVASDIELCDSVKEAIVLAAHDPDIIMAEDKSAQMINNIYNTSASGLSLDRNYDDTFLNCAFSKEVEDILGFNPFVSGNNKYMKSSPANKEGILMLVVNDEASDIAIFIQNSDSSGKKQKHTLTKSSGISIADLDEAQVIYSD